MSELLPTDFSNLEKDGSVLRERGAMLLLYLTHHARTCGVDSCEIKLLGTSEDPVLYFRCRCNKTESTIPLDHRDAIFTKGPTTFENTSPWLD